MHLFPMQRFSDRFGVDLTVADFMDAVTRASYAATQDLASRFRFTNFDAYSTRRDYFFIDRMFHGAEANTADFLLSRGFVSGSAVGKYATSPLHIRNGDANSFVLVADVAEDGESNYGFLDNTNGVFSIFGINLEGMWLAVEYSGGLDTNTDEEFEDVPDWLSEAGMAQTALNLAQHVMFNTEENNSDLGQLRGVINRLFQNHARLKLAAYQPRFTDPTVS